MIFAMGRYGPEEGDNWCALNGKCLIIPKR